MVKKLLAILIILMFFILSSIGYAEFSFNKYIQYKTDTATTLSRVNRSRVQLTIKQFSSSKGARMTDRIIFIDIPQLDNEISRLTDQLNNLQQLKTDIDALP